jgi:hypothetical protein
MKKLSLAIAACILSLSSFAGDVLTLTNNMVFEGKVTRIKKCVISYQVEDATYLIPAADVASIQFADPQDKVYTHYLNLPQGDQNKCMAGRLDAEQFHGKKGGHFALGFLFGPFAMIGTALADPTPYKGKTTPMLSQNKEIFNDPEYLSCYKRKAKGQLIGMEGLGWGSAILLLLLL